MTAQPGRSGVRGPVDAAVQTLLCAGGAAATATLYGSFFAGGDFTPKLAAAAGAAAILAAAASWRRRSRAAVAVVGLLGFAVFAVAVVLTGTLHSGLPDAATAEMGLRALFGGWASMLSVATPAASTPQLLMTPVAVTWAAAYAATVIAWRTRAPVGPGAVLVAADAVALAAVANQPATHYLETVALLAVLVLSALLRARPYRDAPDPDRRAAEGAPSGRGSGARRARGILGRAVMVLAILAVSAGGARILPQAAAARRFDPRTLTPQRLLLDPVLSPLSQVGTQLARKPPATLFTLTVNGSAPFSQITVMALDTFDGSSWSSTDGYLVAGPVLARGPSAPDSATVVEQIRISGLSGPFLPSAGRPEQIDARLGADGALLGFDSSSGVLVTDAATLSGTSYTLVTRIPTAAGLGSASVGSGSAFAADTALPTVPAALVTLADEITAGASSAYGKAQAIASYLRHIPYSADATPGQSYAALLNVLAAPSGHDQAADDEQLVSAFAVLARIVGLPTRIAVGYTLGRPDASVFTVTTADAVAWDQVYFSEHGWVDFDPVDRANKGSTSPGQPFKAPQPSPLPSTQPVKNVPTVEPSHVTGAQPGPSTVDWVPRAALAGAALLVLCLAAAALAADVISRNRRRDRNRGGPSRRAAGAWQEVVDLLTRAGAPLTAAMTIEQVALAAREADPATLGGRVLRAGSGTISDLARTAVRAVFAPEPVEPQEADEAWRLVRRLRSEIRSAAGPAALVRRRIPALLTVRRRGRPHGRRPS